MTWRSAAPLVAALTIALGLAGCGDRHAARTLRQRVCELEAHTARVEDDCRAASAARDQARKRMSSLEKERAMLLSQLADLKRIALERDELRIIVAQRTAERDSVQGHLTQFNRDLQELAARVEQAANQAPPPPASSVVATSRLISPNEK